MDHTQYLKDRIDDQLAWYEKRSRQNKNWYRRLRILSIVIALSIPILTGWLGTGLVPDSVLKIIIAVAGALIGLIEGLMGLNKYHDLWTTYRITAESLKYHRYLFAAGAEPYNVENAFQLFVQTAEGIMASERTNWLQAAKQSGSSENGKDRPMEEEAES